MALAEFRALGERFGISFALTELADRIAVRGEFAAACEHYEQAIAVVTEVGPSRMSSGCGRSRRSCTGCWAMRRPARPPSPRHSGSRSGSPGRTRWPNWPSRRRNSPGGAATRRRRAGNSASRHPCWATQRSSRIIRAVTHDLLGYLAEDLGEARTHRAAAWQAAVAAGYAPMIAQALVGVADLALRRGEYEQAARLLAASTAVRGCRIRSQSGRGPDRADSAEPPRRRAVRRGGSGGNAGQLVSAGGGHTRFLKVVTAHTYPTMPIPAHQARAAIT